MESLSLPLLDASLNDAIVAEAQELAHRLRAELGLHVGGPGEKAIRAVLLHREKPELTQHEAQR